MKKLWNNISHTGTQGLEDESLLRRIILVNRLSAIIWLFIGTSIGINLILQTKEFLVPLSLAWIAVSITYVFNSYQRFLTARLNLFLIVIALLSYMSLKGGAGSGLEFYFLSLLILPVLIFRDKFYIIFLQLLCMACLIFQKFFGEIPVLTDPGQKLVLDVFYVVNGIYSSLLICLGILFYSNIGEKFENKLKENYNTLRNAKDELKKSETLLKEGQKLAKLGSWEWDLMTHSVTWSEELFTILGYEPFSIPVSERVFIAHIHPEDKSSYESVVKNALSTLQPFSIESRIIRKDGEVGAVFSRGRVIPNEYGKPEKVVGFALDITSIKNTREQLRQKDEFIGIASHELKTPLTSTKAYNQLLERALEANDLENAKKYASKAAVYIEQLNLLIHDLMEIARLNSVDMVPFPEFFQFDELVMEVAGNFRESISTHGIIVEQNPSFRIYADKQRIRQVLSNYLSNAVKYSPAGKDVLIRVKTGRNELVFSVQDEGIGIHEDKLPLLFERFYRVEKNSMKFSGLGLGLFICKKIIQAHHGKVWVESSEGKGSVFSFSIPMVYSQE